MAQASESPQPIELRDHYFSLEDGLVPTPTARNCEGSSEEAYCEFSGHLVSPKFISRLLIERGEYPVVPVCFRYPARTTAGWPEWVSFEVQQEEFEEAFIRAGVKISLFISGFCEVYKDDICLRHVVRRWSPETHTFICSWGEFTPSLEDVYNIMRIPIVGDGNPFKIELNKAQKKKLQILEKGAYDSKEVFRFCNWVRHFWGSTDGGKFEHGAGFESGCRVEAMFVYWLSRFVFADFPYENVQQRVFPLAIMLAAGTCFPLAPLFLGHLYRKLDQISKDDKEDAGQYGIDSLVSSFFLQVFVWERFEGLAVEPVTPESLHQLEGGKRDFNLVGFPLCCRWFRRKAKKGAFRPAVLDDIRQFNFRPYFTAHGFQTFPFFYPEGNSLPFLESVELLLATSAQSIIACGGFFDPVMEKYSPHRVKRQFGIDQDVPSHLSYGGHLGDCIMGFTQTDGISCRGMLSDSLGKKDCVGSPTSTFLRFWGLQQCEFRRFIQTGGTRLCPKANSENKRLLRSSTVMGVISRLNLPYTEVYSNGMKRVVGHLKGGKGGDDPEVELPTARMEKGGKSVTKGKVKASEGGGESKRKVCRFKPKVAKDRIPPPVIKSAFGVKVILPSSLAGEKGKKRKAAFTLRLRGVTKRKVTDDASPAVLRRSSRVANMNFSKRKSSSKSAVYVDLSDAPSDDGEGSPLSDNVSKHEENESDTFEGKTCGDGSQAESLEDEDGQGNPTVALMEEDGCYNNQGAHATISMGNCERNVAGASALMKESAVNVGLCADSCNKEVRKVDIGINDLVIESAADDRLCEDDHNEWGGSVLLTGTSFEPHLPKTASGDNDVTVAALVSRGTPLCATFACSLASNSDKSESVSKADLEMRFRKFVACFDTEDRLSITIDDIARPLSGIQSSFEGGKVPSEFVAPLTKFAERYGGGSFSSLFADGKSARQKQKLVKEFGSVLYSMEIEEVKDEETFLIWRDACRDIIDWGLKVNFMLDHLKQAARDFFGYMLRPSGSESSCREIIQMEEAVSKLRKELSHLEQQLGKARGDLCTRLGDDISSDSMSCILGSSWVAQSRATQGLY